MPLNTRLEPAQPSRIRCDVIGCGNSSGRFAGCYGYLCSRHWRMVPTALKRRRAMIAGQLRRRGEIENGDGVHIAKTPRAADLLEGAWRSMVRGARRAASGH